MIFIGLLPLIELFNLYGQLTMHHLQCIWNSLEVLQVFRHSNSLLGDHDTQANKIYFDHGLSWMSMDVHCN